MTPDKPRGPLRGLLDTAAEVSIALHGLGESDETIRRVVRGMALAALGLPARPAVAAPPARPWDAGGDEVTREDWINGGA